MSEARFVSLIQKLKYEGLSAEETEELRELVDRVKRLAAVGDPSCREVLDIVEEGTRKFAEEQRVNRWAEQEMKNMIEQMRTLVFASLLRRSGMSDDAVLQLLGYPPIRGEREVSEEDKKPRLGESYRDYTRRMSVTYKVPISEASKWWREWKERGKSSKSS